MCRDTCGNGNTYILHGKRDRRVGFGLWIDILTIIIDGGCRDLDVCVIRARYMGRKH